MCPWTYLPSFVDKPDDLQNALMTLDWVRRENTPRMEYYAPREPVPYTYGSGRGVRTYAPQPWTEDIGALSSRLRELTGDDLDVCFLNRYLNQRDHLGWHADDSPEMDDGRHIAVISLGVAREIWFRRIETPQTVEKVRLEHGSLLLMKPGMQDVWQHRIPKASFDCGERISLTYRGMVAPRVTLSETGATS